MNKKQREQAEAVAILKEWGLVDGTTVYARVNKVSASGMSRNIGLYIVKDDRPVDISYWAAKALEWGYKDGYSGGVRVSGVGMDMMFHTIYSLSYATGYGSLDQSNSGTDRNINDSGHYGLKYKQL